MNRQPDAGFTLIETLVALSVLALSGVALMGATEAHVARIAALETRAAAQWVAENTLAELSLGSDDVEAPLPMLGRTFAVSETRQRTAEPDLQRIDILVSDPATRQVFARLIGFLDRPADAAGGGG
ncbi:MAG: type II secretion system minor pseudopilin GspI [Gemmobacter sp.]